LILHEILEDSNHYRQHFLILRSQLQPTRCPRASGESPCHIIGWGHWERKPKTAQGEPTPAVPIQRFCCRTHHHTFSLLPPFLLPRIHYLAAEVNDLVERYVRGERITDLARASSLPEEKTIRRWLQKLARNARAIRQEVLARLARCFPTFDQALLRRQRLDLDEARTRSNLHELWALLKSAAQRLNQHRSPYHYALARSS